MTVYKFDISDDQLKEIHEITELLGIPEDERDQEIQEIRLEGGAFMFEYGSLLHKPMSDLASTTEVACVENMEATFNQAFTYYGGTEDKPALMLALQPKAGKKANGLVRRAAIDSANDLIEHYRSLLMRENPVNNPIYRFNERIEARTESGKIVKCRSCLSNTEGPLYLGDLSIRQQAMIIAHNVGPDARLDNHAYRVDGQVKYLDLQTHQKTNFAYLDKYIKAYRDKNLPRNQYLETLYKEVLDIRANMDPYMRAGLDSREGSSSNVVSLFNSRAAEGARTSPTAIYNEYQNTSAMIVTILHNKDSRRFWEREWVGRVPEAGMHLKVA